MCVCVCVSSAAFLQRFELHVVFFQGTAPPPSDLDLAIAASLAADNDRHADEKNKRNDEILREAQPVEERPLAVFFPIILGA